jgi:hypothetical protein
MDNDRALGEYAPLLESKEVTLIFESDSLAKVIGHVESLGYLTRPSRKINLTGFNGEEYIEVTGLNPLDNSMAVVTQRSESGIRFRLIQGRYHNEFSTL